METEVRKIPKKTIIYMIIIILLGVVWLYLVSYGKTSKVTKILHSLGYNRIESSATK